MKEIFKIEANTPLALALLNNIEAQKQLLEQLEEMRFKITEDIMASVLSNEEIQNFVKKIEIKYPKVAP